MAEEKNQSVQYIINHLLQQLYLNKIVPGEKLPPFRNHAKELGVDPSSLRTALKQMESMNLLEIKRSDGAYVNDFMKHAGIDFLSQLFAISESEDPDHVVDEYLVDEVFAFWNMVFPEIMFVASNHFSALDMKKIIEILDNQLAHVDDIEMLTELDIVMQDIVGELSHNMVVTLLFNSLKAIRYRITAVFYRELDRESRIQFLQMKKKGLCRQMSGNLDLKWSSEEHRKALETYRQKIRQSMLGKVFQKDIA
ncbi:MAG: GntR family transcriptional regulator [Proteobacteria bacterium]|nr:GntR family transcriptional regulator [Pseudomonadota bacterium]